MVVADRVRVKVPFSVSSPSSRSPNCQAATAQPLCHYAGLAVECTLTILPYLARRQMP